MLRGVLSHRVPPLMPVYLNRDLSSHFQRRPQNVCCCACPIHDIDYWLPANCAPVRRLTTTHRKQHSIRKYNFVLRHW